MNIGIDGNYFRPFNQQEAAIAIQIQNADFDVSQNSTRTIAIAIMVTLAIAAIALTLVNPVMPLSVKVISVVVSGGIGIAFTAYTSWANGNATGTKKSLENTMQSLGIQAPKPAYWLPNMFPAG